VPDPTLPPPQILSTLDPTPREVREVEKSALREAIADVCMARVGERGDKLRNLLERIETQNGPKAAFDSLIKLLEFAQPKLQRITVQDPDGNAPSMPIINVSFEAPTPTTVVKSFNYQDVELTNDAEQAE
jgi:hypothetical protein